MVQLHVRIVYDFITCFSNAQAQINIIESDGQFFFKAANLLKDLFSPHLKMHARICTIYIRIIQTDILKYRL